MADTPLEGIDMENLSTGWVTFYTVQVPDGPLMAVQKNDGCTRTVLASETGRGEMATNGHSNPGRD